MPTSSNSKFWLGIILGIFGGVFVSKKALQKKRMPNALIWQQLLAEKSSEIEAATRMAQVEKHYEQLFRHRPIFKNQALQTHIEANILPGLALYQTLREDGLNRENALSEIDVLFKEWITRFPPIQIRIYQVMNYLPENFTFFRKAVRFVMDKSYPSAGWQADYVIDNARTLAFNIHRCFYIDILTDYKAPELTASFCKLDDLSMALMPATIRWGRTQTLGLGADFCDFRWDYVPLDEINTLPG